MKLEYDPMLNTTATSVSISENTAAVVPFVWPVLMPTYDICKVRAQFEDWIKARKLVKQYGASLRMSRDNKQYLDVRVEGHWRTWQAAIQNYRKSS